MRRGLRLHWPFLLFLFFFNFSIAFAISPSSSSVWGDFTTEVNVSSNDGHNSWIQLMGPSANCSAAVIDAGDSDHPTFQQDIYSDQNAGTSLVSYGFVSTGIPQNVPLCFGWYNGGFFTDNSVPFTFTGSTPPPPAGSGLSALIDMVHTGFASTTGFTMASSVEWVQEGLIRPFMGGGLAVLYFLRYWIAALLIIGLAVWFAFRAFLFFRH